MATTDPLLDQAVGAGMDQILAVPELRAAVEREATKYFMREYGPPVIAGTVLALGLAFAAGRLSKGAPYEG
jgi:hypothetical protein